MCDRLIKSIDKIDEVPIHFNVKFHMIIFVVSDKIPFIALCSIRYIKF